MWLGVAANEETEMNNAANSIIIPDLFIAKYFLSLN